MNSPSSKYLYGRTSTFGAPLKATKAEEDAIIAQLDPRGPAKGGKKPAGVPPLTHEERQAVIRAPLPAIRVLGHSSAWGGVYVRDTIPTDGQRVWKNTPEDEEWCRSKWEEK